MGFFISASFYLLIRMALLPTYSSLSHSSVTHKAGVLSLRIFRYAVRAFRLDFPKNTECGFDTLPGWIKIAPLSRSTYMMSIWMISLALAPVNQSKHQKCFIPISEIDQLVRLVILPPVDELIVRVTIYNKPVKYCPLSHSLFNQRQVNRTSSHR